jgi:TRAP-type C4-dicarboxylate transport system permease small subunit
MLVTLERWMRRFIKVLLFAGSVLILVQAIWISWGVFARYVLRDPDETVTEATALLLVPLAFVGIAFALQEDAFPKVTMLVEKMPPVVARWVGLFNLTLMTLIGGFFTIVAGSATVRSYYSGAVSAIIEWPEFAFWAPVTLFIGTFTVLGLIKLAIGLTGGAVNEGAG